MTLELGLIIVLTIAFIVLAVKQYQKNCSLEETTQALSKELQKKERDLLDLLEETEESIEENAKLLKTLKDSTSKDFEGLYNTITVLQQQLEMQVKTITEQIQELNSHHELDFTQLNESLLEQNNRISTQLQEHANLIRLLNEQNKEFKRKLEIFTEIESDSKALNSNNDTQEQEDLIDKALKSLEIKIENENNVDITQEKVELLTPKDINPKEHQTEDDNIILDGEQKHAYLQMENTNDNFFITGKAGTGKSFLLRLFVRGTKKKVLKVAPTGIAAFNIDGVTLHSVLGFHNLEYTNIDDMNEKTISIFSLPFQYGRILQIIDTLIIDEISMVRVDVFEKLDKILKILNKNEKPFGGKQLIIFGDVFQLPPVVSNGDDYKYLISKYGGVFFFNSNAYQNGNFNFIELNTNHRQQKDQAFFHILNRIREGAATQEDIDKINERVATSSDDLRRIVRLYPKRIDVSKTNEYELNKIPAKEYIYNLEVTFNKYPDQTLIIENYFNIASALKLKVGALVMMTRNDLSRRWVNGTLAVVSKLSDNEIEVTIDGLRHSVGKDKFEIKNAVYKDGQISYEVIFEAKQYPIILAYAMTIHKSQGTTYQKIACAPHDCFAAGQAYVALSRCASLDGLYLLDRFSENEIQVDSNVKQFYLTAKSNAPIIDEALLAKNESTPIHISGQKIGWKKVEFIEETHQYFVDGVEVPSVTQIVDTISTYHGWDDYAQVNPLVLKKAANKGQKLHKEIEEYELHGTQSDSQEFKNYLEMKNLKGFEVLESEQVIVISRDGVPLAAGRFDMVIAIDGKRGIMDIKRTSKMYLEKVALQLNLYRIGYHQRKGKLVERLNVLRLRENIKQFKDVEIDEASAWQYLDEYYRIIEKQKNTN